MGARLATIVIDADDRHRVASFWAGVLGWDSVEDDDGDFVVFDPDDATGVRLLVLSVPEPKSTKNRLHFDLTPAGSSQAEELDRLLSLGATKLDIGQGEQTWVVLADPGGNEFCLLRRTDERDP